MLVTQTKCCKWCRVTKPVDAFPPNKRLRFGVAQMCRECHNEYRRGSRCRAYNLKKTLKLHCVTADQYARLAAAGCAICGNQCSKRSRLSLDHDHKTGKFRGLLCDKCNRGIALFGDDPAVLRSAARYVAR